MAQTYQKRRSRDLRWGGGTGGAYGGGEETSDRGWAKPGSKKWPPLRSRGAWLKVFGGLLKPGFGFKNMQSNNLKVAL